MTNNRKEPTLSSSLQHDDTPSRTGGSAAARTGASKAAAQPKRPSPPPVSGRPAAAKSSPLVPLALLLALTGLGLAGFSYWQLLLAQQQVSAADKRIASLENKLALTDDESTQSVAALRASLKESKDSLELAHSEIRKLWDTRNVNRNAIAENRKGVDSLQKSVQSAAAAAASAQKSVSEQLQNWKALSSEVALQVEQVKVLTDLSESQQQRIRSLVDSANRLETQFGKMRNELTAKVKNHDEAIQSIDNYRRIVNRDLLQIKQQLSSNP